MPDVEPPRSEPPRSEPPRSEPLPVLPERHTPAAKRRYPCGAAGCRRTMLVPKKQAR